MFDQILEFNYLLWLRKRRFLAAALMVVVIAVVLILAVAWPQATASWQTRQDLLQEREKLTQLQTKLARLQEIPTSLVVQEQDVISQALPSYKPVFELLSILQQVSQQTQVQITELVLNPGELSELQQEGSLNQSGTNQSENSLAPRRGQVNRGAEGVEEVTIVITIQGESGNINTFVNTLNQVTPFISLTQLLLDTTTVAGLEAQDVVSTELELSTFFFTGSVSSSRSAQLPIPTSQHQLTIDSIKNWQNPLLNRSGSVIGGGLEDLFGVVSLGEE